MNSLKLSAIALGLLLTACSKDEINNSCIDSVKKGRNKICTMELAPVCGCDGKTYGNACVAEREGVKTWTIGECPTETAN